MTRSTTALAAAAALALSGCASSPRRADAAFAAGDYAAAAPAYEARLAAGSADADRVLFRLGVAYGLASSPVHDAARARERLAALVARYPGSPYRAAADLVLELDDAAASSGERAACLQEELDELTARSARAENEATVSAQAALRQKDEELVRSRAALAEAQAQLQRVLRELEQLKRIDLQRAP